jgi:alpha-galactosidase
MAEGVTRRSFLGSVVAVTAAGAAADSAKSQSAHSGRSSGRATPLLDILRVPDRVTAFAGLDHAVTLTHSANAWQGHGVQVEFAPDAKQMPVTITSPSVELTHIHLRWSVDVDSRLRCLGDHWERSYGDLAWRGIIPERVMPWYFLSWDGETCHGYGVKTGAGALCFWQLDQEGVSLWLNLCNGGAGVQLGNRRLEAATIVSRSGQSEEPPLSVARAFCRVMCEKPRLPASALYGSNDWYYAYGRNSAAQTLRDADRVAEFSAGLAVRPYTVIDDGWRDPARFPDMRALASEIKRRDVRPGIWIRPLIAPTSTPKDLLLPDLRFGTQKERAREVAYDPTHPDALRLILAKATEVVEFGFELVKHDYTTFDLLGRWGFEMGPNPTSPGWSLRDRSRTNAEVIRDLYEAIRKACGEPTLILGCNTVGHLAAGVFEAQRTGDDTSGENWERTRKMGINTLAFRLPQNGTFFSQDPDCVGITPAVPWEYNRQWLDVVARSGAALFISLDPRSAEADLKERISESFRIAASGGSNVCPTDWLDTTSPEHWSFPGTSGEDRRYRWCSLDGASPFAT